MATIHSDHGCNGDHFRILFLDLYLDEYFFHPSRKSFQIFSTVSVVIYMVVLLVLISVQVGAVIAGIILKDQIATQDTLAEFFDGFVRLYDNPAIQTIIDGWQSGFMCCGYNGSSSWFINGSNFTRPNLPDSCCSRNTTQQCTVSNAFDQGCSPVYLLCDELHWCRDRSVRSHYSFSNCNPR